MDTRTLPSLYIPISPPPLRRQNTTIATPLASIEAGQVSVPKNPLEAIASQLPQYIRPCIQHHPRIEFTVWKDLYRRNTRSQGTHFVIHQHDHPVAGPHYDLRLQFSQSSSLSWSLMYGLPGDANSRRINRNATETRVHCLWNHLIETASSKTGSLIIWDTGEYEVLDETPYMPIDTEPESESEEDSKRTPIATKESTPTQSQKLRQAFHSGKIRLRLHGTRLPQNYTVLLRRGKDAEPSWSASATTTRKRKRKQQLPETPEETTSDSESSEFDNSKNLDLLEKDQIRQNNAYSGATNDIGSVHQRRWFLSLDRAASGFVEEWDPGARKKRWVRRQEPQSGQLLGFEPFYVHGPEIERSLVTGRLGSEVLEDEKVQGFRPRRGWRPVLQ